MLGLEIHPDAVHARSFTYGVKRYKEGEVVKTGDSGHAACISPTCLGNMHPIMHQDPPDSSDAVIMDMFHAAHTMDISSLPDLSIAVMLSMTHRIRWV